MKRVLSIQDLSCAGRCSLTVALPVLSAMGISCVPLPTAILSTHTAFPAPHIRSLTEDITPIARHWQSVGVTFDAISVGYLADPAQATAVETVLDTFPSLTVIDPVLGDHGKLYSGITQDHVAAMSRLCCRGRLLLPNITEAAALTGLPYRQTQDSGYYRELAAGMLDLGAETAVLTGVSLSSGNTGLLVACQSGEDFVYQAPQIPKQLHGTGDLFCCVFTGALVRGYTAFDAATLAARFVERVISATKERSSFGAEFEPQLSWLWEQL